MAWIRKWDNWSINWELVETFALVQPAAVFSLLGMLLDKGINYATIYAFISSTILIGVSILPAEIKFFGKKVSIIRNRLIFCYFYLLFKFLS